MKNSNIFFLLLLSALIISGISGCKRDPIVEKLARGQALSAEENASYTKSADHKKQYDEYAKERKEHIAWENYRPPTQSEIKAGTRKYKLTNGKEFDLNIDPAVCQALGFLPGSKVKIEGKGESYVVGVDKDNDLWFHVDGVEGAEFWHNYKKEDFAKKSFVLVNAPKAPVQTVAEANVEAVEQVVIPPVQEEQSKPAPPPPPPPQKPAGNKPPPAKTATTPGGEIHADEIEKLPPIPPIPPLKEK